MKVSALQRILFTERIRRHSGGIYFLKEEPASSKETPFTVSTSKGSFLTVNKVSKEGTIRYALSILELEQEDTMVGRLFSYLLAESESNSWSNVHTTVQEAVDSMASIGFPARSVVLPKTSLIHLDLSDKNMSDCMDQQGYVTKIGDIQVLVGNIPDNCAIVASSPSITGQYTRVYNSVGLFIRNTNKVIHLVKPS
jgi:hypothetical protein